MGKEEDHSSELLTCNRSKKARQVQPAMRTCAGNLRLGGLVHTLVCPGARPLAILVEAMPLLARRLGRESLSDEARPPCSRGCLLD